MTAGFTAHSMRVALRTTDGFVNEAAISAQKNAASAHSSSAPRQHQSDRKLTSGFFGIQGARVVGNLWRLFQLALLLACQA